MSDFTKEELQCTYDDLESIYRKTKSITLKNLMEKIKSIIGDHYCPTCQKDVRDLIQKFERE